MSPCHPPKPCKGVLVRENISNDYHYHHHHQLQTRIEENTDFLFIYILVFFFYLCLVCQVNQSRVLSSSRQLRVYGVWWAVMDVGMHLIRQHVWVCGQLHFRVRSRASFVVVAQRGQFCVSTDCDS
ncbi:hypothetical protein E2C01_079620 [Portunus trituberculatus]|uniref:Uncharacterized protein n=1 Tax=Portunus trituberculatus TaxID=210409 RepID=A0A5B7IK13_PORTR|nr:hypothetical protein [Portunus trituberculatus]